MSDVDTIECIENEILESLRNQNIGPDISRVLSLNAGLMMTADVISEHLGLTTTNPPTAAEIDEYMKFAHIRLGVIRSLDASGRLAYGKRVGPRYSRGVRYWSKGGDAEWRGDIPKQDALDEPSCLKGYEVYALMFAELEQRGNGQVVTFSRKNTPYMRRKYMQTLIDRYQITSVEMVDGRPMPSGTMSIPTSIPTVDKSKLVKFSSVEYDELNAHSVACDASGKEIGTIYRWPDIHTWGQRFTWVRAGKRALVAKEEQVMNQLLLHVTKFGEARDIVAAALAT